MNMNEPKIVTHDGIFHADEVIAVAIISEIYGPDNIKIVRTRVPSIIEKGDIVIDVGGEYDIARTRFDHHQRDFDLHYRNGIRYASAGLVWKSYGRKYIYLNYHKNYTNTITDDALELVSAHLSSIIKTIDAVDNGQMDLVGITDQITLSQIISSFNPISSDATPEERNRCFERAVDFARDWLSRTIEATRYKYENYQILDTLFKANGNRGIVIMETFVPWTEWYMENMERFSHVNLVVFPGTDSTWRVQTTPLEPGKPQSMRCPAPKEVRGLRNAELDSTTQLDGTMFVHAGGFIGGATDRASALALARWWYNQVNNS